MGDRVILRLEDIVKTFPGRKGFGWGKGLM